MFWRSNIHILPNHEVAAGRTNINQEVSGRYHIDIAVSELENEIRDTPDDGRAH
jgi:hypothetical protein